MSTTALAIISGLAGLLQAVCLLILTHVLNRLEKISDKNEQTLARLGEYVKAKEFNITVNELRGKIDQNTKDIVDLQSHHRPH